MANQSAFTLVNPLDGTLAFKIFSFDDNSHFDHIQRNNYFSLIWVQEGEGVLRADFSEYHFGNNSLFAFAPYQPYMLSSDQPLKGKAILFHSAFFCIYRHDKEISSHGVLYNNIYQPPFVRITEEIAEIFASLYEQMKNEMQNTALAQHELLVAYLKIFLINAARLKKDQQAAETPPVKDVREPEVLNRLKRAIEENFKREHSPSAYADMLHISPKALARLAKSYFNKTLSSLINERIIIEAKRELYLTNKTVKQIAWELGYEDEYYFSRFFKVNADVSPQLYRDTVGAGKQVA